jgi:diadenosine tetraphosphate (Ap4A) HIT family hydrolase
MSDVSFWANGHFRVEPCISCPIVGYLIVSPQAPVSSLSELSSSAQALLGPTLAASTRAIETVVQPERVYCLLFAEETRSVHFHLFPRTKWLLLSIRCLIPTFIRCQDRGSSIGRATHFDRLLAPSIIRSCKESFVRLIVTSSLFSLGTHASRYPTSRSTRHARRVRHFA